MKVRGDRLVLIRCDYIGCESYIRPNPDIAKSGWVVFYRQERGEILTWDYCPEHATRV
jgi:hypothetical protein